MKIMKEATEQAKSNKIVFIEVTSIVTNCYMLARAHQVFQDLVNWKVVVVSWFSRFFSSLSRAFSECTNAKQNCLASSSILGGVFKQVQYTIFTPVARCLTLAIIEGVPWAHRHFIGGIFSHCFSYWYINVINTGSSIIVLINTSNWRLYIFFWTWEIWNCCLLFYKWI